MHNKWRIKIRLMQKIANGLAKVTSDSASRLLVIIPICTMAKPVRIVLVPLAAQISVIRLLLLLLILLKMNMKVLVPLCQMLARLWLKV